MSDPYRQRIHWQFARFLVVGAANTVLAWGVYWAALHLVHRQYAFIITYLVSLAFAAVAHSRLSFGLRMQTIGFAAYACYGVAMYLFGAGMLEAIVRVLGVGQGPAIAVLTIVQLPVNFFASRWVMMRFARTAQVDDPSRD